MNGIAFFDLDGTITTKDTYIDFIKYCRGRKFYYLGLCLLSPFILFYLIKFYPNYKLKEKFFHFYLSKYPVSTLNELGNRYAEMRLPSLIRSLAMERILWHKHHQHRVIILTASSSIWLSKWCEQHHLELIGTSFFIENHHYTGKIQGKNCYGKQKKIIVQKILESMGDIQTYGYGDTPADLFFMELVREKFYKPFI